MSASTATVRVAEGVSIPHPDGIFCPVGRALDAIGDRWTLVIIRHLLDGARGFQELRARTGIVPRVLSARLRQLENAGFLENVGEGRRSAYQLTDRGRSLEPVLRSIARWYLLAGMDHLAVDPNRFSETSARSVLESLPYLIREERVDGVSLQFEIRLSGAGGGVWTVQIADGRCTVRDGFADHADVRYTADARIWCAVALGLAEAKDIYRQGLMTKDGSREAMDFYFHQINRPRKTNGPAKPGRRSTR